MISPAALPDRLHEQIAFLVEIDKLKSILRQTPIADGSRRENTAEHSWHLAMFALVLAEHAPEPIDVARVITMLLLHDIVEIDAGDTFIYAAADPAVAAQQEADELAAAHRIFSLLPVDQAARLRALWDEFEAKETADSKFAKTIDRLQPILLNRVSGGGSWTVHAITADKTRRMVRSLMPAESVLTDYALTLIEEAIAHGLLLPDPAESVRVGQSRPEERASPTAQLWRETPADTREPPGTVGGVSTVAAYILLQTDVGKSSSVCKAVGVLSGVVSCEEVTGPYDLIVKAESDSLDELGKQVVSRIQLVEGITRTLTCPVIHF